MEVQIQIIKLEYKSCFNSSKKNFFQLKAVFTGFNKEEKNLQNKFLIIIEFTETKIYPNYLINDTIKYCQEYSPKKINFENNQFNPQQNQENKLIVKWEIPANQLLPTFEFNEGGNKFKNLGLLKLLVMEENGRLINRDHILEIKNFYYQSQDIQFYETQYNEYQIQHELILKRSNTNQIPFSLYLNKDVFKKGDQIKLKLEFDKSCLQIQEVKASLVQKYIILEQIAKQQIFEKLDELRVDQRDYIFKNNYIVDQIIPENIKAQPLYLGKSQCHHYIIIKITFFQKFCFDLDEKYFYITIPIEVTDKQIDQNDSNNQNQFIECQQGGEIKLNFCFSELKYNQQYSRILIQNKFLSRLTIKN